MSYTERVSSTILSSVVHSINVGHMADGVCELRVERLQLCITSHRSALATSHETPDK